MEYEIRFPTPLEAVDPCNDNLDVCLRMHDGREYTFVVATPEHLKAMMKHDGIPYLKPGLPFLIAEELTEAVIARLIGEVAADDAMLRIYGSDL